MNGHDASEEELAQPDEEEEEERRQHLADILDRATAIHYSSETVTPNNGLSMNARRPTGNGFLRQESRDARTRLRRALLASSLGIPPRRTNGAQHMPQDDRLLPTEPELTLADLDRTLNNMYDYRIRPNMTAGDATGNAGDAENSDAYEPYYNGHYSAPQLTTTSSLLMDTDEDEDEERYQHPSQADQANFNAAPQGQEGSMTGDRARLRTMLLRSLAVPSTSLDIGINTGHSSTNPTPNGNFDFSPQRQQHRPTQPATPHHVDATISLRTAIQRAHRDLVVLDDEFRRMCEAARSRSVDEDGNELQFDMKGVEEEEEASPSHDEHDQQEQLEQLAHIVLPSSASAVARQASFSSQEDQRPVTEEQQQQQQDRSKARANADVAGTAILPLARKDTKRAQAA